MTNVKASTIKKCDRRNQNEVRLEFLSKSENEAFARMTASSFATLLDPTIEELSDIKTAVSEAVTNSIVHGYAGKKGYIYMECTSIGDTITIVIKDYGCGIKDVKQAMEPMFTTNTDGERSGMGFTVMETFMDTVEVESVVDVGTKVTMTKTIGKNSL